MFNLSKPTFTQIFNKTCFHFIFFFFIGFRERKGGREGKGGEEARGRSGEGWGEKDREISICYPTY